MSWVVGDRVEVYDPDDKVWHPGVVEEQVTAKGFRFLIVQTDTAQYEGLPLKIGVPADRTEWIRTRTS